MTTLADELGNPRKQETKELVRAIDRAIAGKPVGEIAIALLAIVKTMPGLQKALTSVFVADTAMMLESAAAECQCANCKAKRGQA